MASLLLQIDTVLSAFITNMLTVVPHALHHLLELLVVILHRLLALFIGVPDVGQTSEDSFRLLHLFLSDRPLACLTQCALFLHVFQLSVQASGLIQRLRQGLIDR